MFMCLEKLTPHIPTQGARSRQLTVSPDEWLAEMYQQVPKIIKQNFTLCVIAET